MTRILVTGRNGQLGWELRRSLLAVGTVVAPGRDRLDLADPDSLRRAVDEAEPDVIVNAAAYTGVDQAETERERAFAINGAAPGVLAEEAKRRSALLIHYSTDYVFDGAKATAYSEDDAPAPVNAYGESKLEGERAIAEADCEHLVLRTSWVYSHRGKNFLLTILRLARERRQLRVVDDQRGAPTSARFLADASAAIIVRSQEERRRGSFVSGVFHLTCDGETSWHGFARTAIEGARKLQNAPSLAVEEIVPIASGDYQLPARRPLHSRLATCRVGERFGIMLAPWEQALQLCLEDLYGPV